MSFNKEHRNPSKQEESKQHWPCLVGDLLITCWLTFAKRRVFLFVLFCCLMESLGLSARLSENEKKVRINFVSSRYFSLPNWKF